MFVTLSDLRLACYERGKGRAPALLLIHGFPLDHRLWEAQRRGLAADAHIIAPDLRGHGRSTVTPGPLTMDQHADDLAALLDHLHVKRAIVAGLSMGGYIAFALWRRHPERVRALVLADTRAEPDSAVARLGRDAAAERVRQTGVPALADEMLPKLLAPVSQRRPRLAQTARDMLIAQPAEGVIGALAGLRDRADSRPTLSTITVPTLVLAGEDDVLTPPADAAALAAAIPGARFVTIPQAGHLSPLENPRAFNTALRGFVREMGRQ